MEKKLLFVIAISFISSTYGQSTECFTPMGSPPQFVRPPPADIIISETVFQPAGNGVMANLILPCEATGNPTPTINWFTDFGGINQLLSDENVMDDGTLAINTTDIFLQLGVRSQTTLYCTASNMIGEGNTTNAVLRSREVNVSLSVFFGFSAFGERVVPIETIEGGSVALTCDTFGGNPTPQIQWFADGIPIQEDPANDSILILKQGSILFIRELTAEQRNKLYHCNVTHEGEQFRDPITYSLSTDLSNVGLTEYLQITQEQPAMVGVPERLVYSAAARDASGNRVDIELSCASTPLVSLTVSNGLIITAVLQPAAAEEFPTFQCNVTGPGISEEIFGFVDFSPPPITFPPLPGVGPNDIIMDRGHSSGCGQVDYFCPRSQSSFSQVRWFYNSMELRDFDFSLLASLGVEIVSNENGSTLVVSDPQVSNSGIYQCSLQERFDFNEVGMRAWILEVSERDINTPCPASPLSPCPMTTDAPPTVPTTVPMVTTDTVETTVAATTDSTMMMSTDGATDGMMNKDSTITPATLCLLLTFFQTILAIYIHM